MNTDTACSIPLHKEVCPNMTRPISENQLFTFNPTLFLPTVSPGYPFMPIPKN